MEGPPRKIIKRFTVTHKPPVELRESGVDQLEEVDSLHLLRCLFDKLHCLGQSHLCRVVHAVLGEINCFIQRLPTGSLIAILGCQTIIKTIEDAIYVTECGPTFREWVPIN
jgi:hypothetical protein